MAKKSPRSPVAAPGTATTIAADVAPDKKKPEVKQKVDAWAELLRAMQLARKPIHTLNINVNLKFYADPKPDMTPVEAFLLMTLLTDQFPFLDSNVWKWAQATGFARHIEMRDVTRKAAA